jgi:RimJ/RimL family protein N-acetyltransferase
MRVTLQTTRLVLEPWSEHRLEEFVRLTADERVMQGIGRGGPWSRVEAEHRFAEALRHWELHGFGWRSAVEHATGVWVGLIALNHVGPGIEGVASDEVEIGWWLDVGAWRRGFATEGAGAVGVEAFDRVGVGRVIARTRPGNAASLHIMSKLGMTPWVDTTGRHGEQLRVFAIDRETWRQRELSSPDTPIHP